mmetsp:Transcript_42299/g.97931  ORF Transcript_42299/g.97931 Transcript_42299/m.97931 type:complete len:103 (-) Transcript_42299:384-692(-)
MRRLADGGMITELLLVLTELLEGGICPLDTADSRVGGRSPLDTESRGKCPLDTDSRIGGRSPWLTDSHTGGLLLSVSEESWVLWNCALWTITLQLNGAWSDK